MQGQARARQGKPWLARASTGQAGPARVSQGKQVQARVGNCKQIAIAIEYKFASPVIAIATKSSKQHVFESPKADFQNVM